jgi:hypothetical protein
LAKEIRCSFSNMKIRFVASILLFFGGLCDADTPGFPKGTNLSSIVVISENALGNTAQRVMVATLQGLVARRSPNQIYITGSSAGYNLWPGHLKAVYGISYTTSSNPWSLVNQYRHLVDGYILYSATGNSNSVNAATSLAGPLNGIAIDSSIEATVRSQGITNRLVDLRGRDEAWVWTNYNAILSRSIFVEQTESISANLRDYAVLAGAFTFYDGNSNFRKFILGQAASDAACLGWGDSSSGEDIPVTLCSSNGLYTVGSDWALNLSTLSSIRDDTISQRALQTKSLPAETNVHYVTFVITDGDNVQWNVGDLAGYYSHAARGSFNMGWSISPALADLAPSVLRWYYDNASNTPNRDVFTAGTSGMGYFYPSKYPGTELDIHAEKLNSFMGRADIDIVHVNDFYSVSRLDLWNKYLSQPNIQGLFYLEYSRYNFWGGSVFFSTNGRPIISARNLLWGGVEEPAAVTASINSYPRDPSGPGGYTLVEVHVWTKTLADVQSVVAALSPDVRVVTPDVFAKLVRNNVGRKLSYDFVSNLQGWTSMQGSDPGTTAAWTGSQGNPNGALSLRSGSTESSFSWRQIILPQNAASLRFDTRAHHDGSMRVLLVPVSGTATVLLDWEKLAVTNVWVSRTASLTNYAGQTVFLYFQQQNGGLGNDGTRYVDNVGVLTDGPPVYKPDAPRLLTAVGGNTVNLTWRDNSPDETGFHIDRAEGDNGAWLQIGTVAYDVERFTDSNVKAGTNYAYRIRSFNLAGAGNSSNARTVSTPRRPVITPLQAGDSLILNWPSWASGFLLHSASDLGTGAAWSPVSGSATNPEGAIYISVPTSAHTQFFRLQTP